MPQYVSQDERYYFETDPGPEPLRRVDVKRVSDVSEALVASIFRVGVR
jgi:hypothetical protein